MTDTTRPRHIAVYGTLMRPFDAQERLGIAGQLAYEGPCRFEGVLYDVGAFPGAVPGDVVQGELLREINQAYVTLRVYPQDVRVAVSSGHGDPS